MALTPVRIATLYDSPTPDPDTQSKLVIEGYRQTPERTPAMPLQRRPHTLSELTGPLEQTRRLKMLGADIASEAGARAIGQVILVKLRILDEDGAPVPGTVVEMWQANAAGRYVHPNDDDHAPIDPHFYGAARVQTDESGAIAIRTIKPGAYAVPDTGGWWRPPHIHFSVWGKIWLARTVTQMLFPGEPLNDQDRILLAVPSAEARSRLVCRMLAPTGDPKDALVFEHDIVVRGARATPQA